MCSLIQKYRCQVREYLQSMCLGTGSPRGPQLTASTSGWSSLRLWDKDGLALSLPTLCSPETPRSGDSHRQPTPKGASRLTWETSPSNSLKQAGFKQKAALFFPPATALRSAWSDHPPPPLDILEWCYIFPIFASSKNKPHLVGKTHSQAWSSQNWNISPMPVKAQPPLPQPMTSPPCLQLSADADVWAGEWCVFPLPFHTSSTSTQSSSGVGAGGWCKVDKGATRSVLLWCSVDASREPPSQA